MQSGGISPSPPSLPSLPSLPSTSFHFHFLHIQLLFIRCLGNPAEGGGQCVGLLRGGVALGDLFHAAADRSCHRIGSSQRRSTGRHVLALAHAALPDLPLRRLHSPVAVLQPLSRLFWHCSHSRG